MRTRGTANGPKPPFTGPKVLAPSVGTRDDPEVLPSLEDLLVGVEEILAEPMLAAGYARIEASAGAPGQIVVGLGQDPVGFLRMHAGRYPARAWWQVRRLRGRLSLLWIGFEGEGADNEDVEKWVEYDALTGDLDTSQWFPYPRWAEAQAPVASVGALRLRLTHAAETLPQPR